MTQGSKQRRVFSLARVFLCLATCVMTAQARAQESSIQSMSDDSNAPAAPANQEPAADPQNQGQNYEILAPPLWETDSGVAHHDWTQFAAGIVDHYGEQLVQGTKDVKSFCPAYFTLNRAEKINFWVYLVSAVARYESGLDPLARMKEPSMGHDSITHEPVYSEGLLQLSYQDIQVYSFCDFSWTLDRSLGVKDPNRTILNPNRNLSCGIRILNEIVGRRDQIAFRAGQYWSTLMPGDRHSKVKAIQALTRQLPFCR